MQYVPFGSISKEARVGSVDVSGQPLTRSSGTYSRAYIRFGSPESTQPLPTFVRSGWQPDDQEYFGEATRLYQQWLDTQKLDPLERAHLPQVVEPLPETLIQNCVALGGFMGNDNKLYLCKATQQHDAAAMPIEEIISHEGQHGITYQKGWRALAQHHDKIEAKARASMINSLKNGGITPFASNIMLTEDNRVASIEYSPPFPFTPEQRQELAQVIESTWHAIDTQGADQMMPVLHNQFRAFVKKHLAGLEQQFGQPVAELVPILAQWAQDTVGKGYVPTVDECRQLLPTFPWADDILYHPLKPTEIDEAIQAYADMEHAVQANMVYQYKPDWMPEEEARMAYQLGTTDERRARMTSYAFQRPIYQKALASLDDSPGNSDKKAVLTKALSEIDASEALLQKATQLVVINAQLEALPKNTENMGYRYRNVGMYNQLLKALSSDPPNRDDLQGVVNDYQPLMRQINQPEFLIEPSAERDHLLAEKHRLMAGIRHDARSAREEFKWLLA